MLTVQKAPKYSRLSGDSTADRHAVSLCSRFCGFLISCGSMDFLPREIGRPQELGLLTVQKAPKYSRLSGDSTAYRHADSLCSRFCGFPISCGSMDFLLREIGRPQELDMLTVQKAPICSRLPGDSTADRHADSLCSRFCGFPISCGSMDFNRERLEDRKSLTCLLYRRRRYAQGFLGTRQPTAMLTASAPASAVFQALAVQWIFYR
jgi:hypothetical protein